MPDSGTHTTLLAPELPSTLACLLDSHAMLRVDFWEPVPEPFLAATAPGRSSRPWGFWNRLLDPTFSHPRCWCNKPFTIAE